MAGRRDNRPDLHLRADIFGALLGMHLRLTLEKCSDAGCKVRT
jgi:hypothetical protein